MPDAVMYCLSALERFEKLTTQQVQDVGFEIAILGMRGDQPRRIGNAVHPQEPAW